MANSSLPNLKLSCLWLESPAWEVVVRRVHRTRALWNCTRGGGPVQSRFGCTSRSASFGSPRSATRYSARARHNAGFTLLELLVVIAIVAILAGLLLPAIGVTQTKTKVRQAKLDANQITAAIKQFEALYDRFPVTKEVEAVAGNGDFTFSDDVPPGRTVAPQGLRNNREVMEILLDIDRPNGFNQGHRRNFKQIRMLDAKQNTGTGPGISVNDWTFRDPWGKPYVITLDMNEDGKCRDELYSLPKVSGIGSPVGGPGLLGLVRGTAAGKEIYELNNSVMVWSSGPDGQASPDVPANQGVNKNNVVGW